MQHKSLSFALILAAAVLSGCGGRDFVRPADGALTLGKSTKNDVIASLGEPARVDNTTANGEAVELLNYSHGSPALPGMIHTVRAFSAGIHKDRLVSTAFTSSYDEDNTDFDAAKVASIVKGKTNRAEIIALLGKPTGESIPPVVKTPDHSAMLYLHAKTRNIGVGRITSVKRLSIELDQAGVVHEITASGLD